MRRSVDKQVVVLFHDAAKEVLSHLSRWKIRLNECGRDAPRGLASVYGRVRRLRDYLQRMAMAYSTPVEIDLGADEENLLVSCAVHYLGVVDLALQTDKSPAETAELELRRQQLSEWAVYFASAPVERIPSPDAVQLNTPSARAIVTTVMRQCGTPARPAGIPTASPSAAPSAGPAPPVGVAPPPAPAGVHAPPPSLPAPPSIPSPPAAAPPASPPPGAAHPAGAGWTPPRPPGPSGQPPGGIAPPGAGAPAMSGTAEGGLPLEPDRMYDARLRTIMAMDLNAYVRARSAQDFRLAMVHLSSILEGAVVDHALPRAQALGLRGTPETWKLEEILARVIGDRLGSMDRAYLYQVIGGRNLLRPSIQLQAPMVVTSQSLDQAEAFVRRVVEQLGLCALPEQPSADPTAAAFFGAAVASNAPQRQLAPDPGRSRPSDATARPGRPGRPPPWPRR